MTDSSASTTQRSFKYGKASRWLMLMLRNANPDHPAHIWAIPWPHVLPASTPKLLLANLSAQELAKQIIDNIRDSYESSDFANIPFSPNISISAFGTAGESLGGVSFASLLLSCDRQHTPADAENAAQAIHAIIMDSFPLATSALVLPSREAVALVHTALKPVFQLAAQRSEALLEAKTLRSALLDSTNASQPLKIQWNTDAAPLFGPPVIFS